MSVSLDNLTTHPTLGHLTRSQTPIYRQQLPPSEITAPTEDRRLLLVLQLINEDIRRQLMIRELATIVNLSPGRLAHLFKTEVGISPQRYVNNVRLKKARELLESGMLSVKEIAAQIGFPNVSSFCRSFRACYGTTPREYRNIHLRMDLKSIAASTASA
jgi:transcriptional regulator GlxA family with amidase domain